MEFKGKLIGALVGSLAGPMGTVLGGLLGHLFDRAREEQRTLRGLRPGDSITTAQLNFLASLIGLSVAATDAGGRPRPAQVAALKAFFRDTFPYPGEDERLLAQMIDEAFLKRRDLDVKALCRYYKNTSSAAGRLLLLRLVLKVTAAAPGGPDPEQLILIRLIASELGVEASLVQAIEAEFWPAGKRFGARGRGPQERRRRVELLSGEQAYAILGIPPEATDEAVRSRYRRMAAQHHPDRMANLGEEFVSVAEEKFKLIGEAYRLIGRERGWARDER